MSSSMRARAAGLLSMCLLATTFFVAPATASATSLAATTTVLTSDGNPSVHGQGVTFTAIVSPSSPGGAVTNYTGTGISNPLWIAHGSDGALWFTNSQNSSIGRISTTGTVTNYTDPTISTPYGIAAGPDAALWFANYGNNSIGRISTTGTVTNYTGTGIDGPYGVAAGPDGALWFTNVGNNSIGRISTTGTVTNYTGTGIDSSYGIAGGPDGALWFTNHNNNSIGRISTAGTVTNYTGTGVTGPNDIAAGPDGALWFANYNNNSIGRISTTGTVTNYTGTGVNGPNEIAAGPDGALWFTNAGNNSIGRISTTGTVTNYTGTGIDGPNGIAAGPDGALWFTNTENNSIGRITSPSAGIPAGTVQFQDGGTDIAGCESVALSAGEATCGPLTDLSTAAHSITAVFSGDADFATSTSDPLSQVVNKADTTTAITGVDLATTSVTGQTYTVSWSVTATSPGAGTPTGTVTVSGGSGCDAPVGDGQCDVVSTTAGLKSLVATYDGDDNFNGSASDGTDHQVDLASTTTGLLSDTNPSVHGQGVTFTATVSAVSPGSGTPTGTVQFQDGGTDIAGCESVALSAGEATCGPLTDLSTATHSITAIYSGDADYATSTSDPLSQVVNATNTTTSITGVSLGTATAVGESYTVSWSVASVSPGSGAPTGTVTITGGSGCSASVASGSCSFASDTAGVKTLVATYVSDSLDFNSSASSGTSHTVNKGSTTTALVSNSDPSVFGQDVTFTATVRDHAVSNYTGTGISGLTGIAAGPDGALWFSNYSNNSIGRISTSGLVTNYTDVSISRPYGIAAGPDGALWFTNSNNNSIGRISIAGTVTNYTGTGISFPFGIAAGPDGALWFLNGTNNSIGRISTAGTVTNYSGSGISSPQGIAAGPDGAMWFTNSGNNRIGRISTAGTVNIYTGSGINTPFGIAAGPDGALWFTNNDNNSIGRITTTGTVTNYTGTGINYPVGIATGPDGALWFTNSGNNSIGRVSTTGTVTKYTGTGILNPQGIVAGADGALWFANVSNNTIGRIGPTGTPAGTINFKDGAATMTGCGAAAVNGSGVATCGPISGLSKATHVITAIYSGDTNYNTSTSGTLSQVVNKSDTTTAITGVNLSTNSVTGEKYTVSWSVTPTAPGAGTPTGTVTVSGGSGCSAPVGDGQCDVVSTAAGLKTLVATYDGDDDFNGSASAGTAHTVDKANTTATLISDTNPSVTGQGVTFTATVTDNLVTNYTGTGISSPNGITTGPDGALWFTNTGNHSIGRISTAGTVTNYTGTGIVGPYAIAAGPDGALWFTNYLNNSIGRISTTGTVTNYTDPSINGPYGIAAGSDGALWFPNRIDNSIGRITTAGIVTNFTDPSMSDPREIAAGPDGALWFTNVGNDSIGRISTAGVVTNYTDPSISGLRHIAAGSDGALWFTNQVTFSIGRISTAGTVTNYSGVNINNPLEIAAGPDGALWFTNDGNNSIGRISTAGTVTNYTGVNVNNQTAIAAGPDGAVWFTNNGQNAIGRISGHVGSATGTVAFKDGASTIAGCGAAAVNGSGVATCGPIGDLSTATHSITAVYSGDTNYNTSTSDPLAQVVNAADTSTSVVSDTNPSVHGQGVTFTATVSAVSPGSGTPTGTVQFQDGGTDIAGCESVALSAGEATCGPLTDLSTATHSITAIYSGDADYATSTSDPLSQVVNKADTTTGVASDVNPSVHGQGVTFTATVVSINSPPSITSHSGTGINYPEELAAASDGAIWFTNYFGQSIGRITTGGSVTNFTGTGISYPHGITAGPDGALWFTNYFGTESIGRITTGGAVTTYTDASISNPTGITVGPDGALWFTNTGNHSIGRITTGGTVSNFTGADISSPYRIVVGSDGALWFTNATSDSIGRITTAGVVTNYTGTGIWGPSFIVSGPDGALWFGNLGNDSIGRVTTAGVVTNYTGVGIDYPQGLAVGPDGAIWFSNYNNGSIGRITMDGDVSNFPDASVGGPRGMIRGPDNALWFGNSGGNTIGRIQPVFATGTVDFKDGATTICTAGALDATGEATCGPLSDLSTATHSITAIYSGDADFNTSDNSAGPLSQVVDKADTTTAITGVSLGTATVVGQSYTVGWSVTPTSPGAGTPTGTVTVTGGSGCDAPVGDGQCDLVSTTAGSETLVATYEGDGDFNGSVSSGAPHGVAAADTTIGVVSDINPSVHGQGVTFTATVSASFPGAGTPTGTVDFFDGATLICDDAALDGTAEATCGPISDLATGTHANITALYSGDADFIDSGNGLTPYSQVVNEANTTASVTSDFNPSAFGQGVTFTATVGVVAPGTGTPTGTVDFFDGATLICDDAPLNGSAEATCGPITNLTTASHPITAIYSGDSNYATSTSSTLNQVVNNATTTTTLASSANPVVHGQDVSWTATVASGSGVPTGSVQFKIDGNNFGLPVVLNGSGQATSPIAHPSTGGHIVRAFYLGSAIHLPSASAQLHQGVNKALTLTTVWTTRNPQSFGNPFTLHVTVTPVAPGAGIPNGMVQFYVDGKKFGPLVRLNRSTGSATLLHPKMSRGNHTIKAMYQGFVNFQASTSANYTHQIN